MKKFTIYLISSLLLFATAMPLFAAADPYNQYLTVNDVQKISGLQGLKLVPRNSINGAAGELNFADAGNHLVLMVRFFTASYFKSSFNQIKPYIKEPVSGIGDQAYIGPKDSPQYLIYFCKKRQSASINTFFDPSGKKPTMLSVDQLKSIAKLMASRMQ